MLQECIERLNSGILTFKDNKVSVIGFISIDRLNDFYQNSINCFSSQGLYTTKELDWSKIKDNSLFILIKDHKEFNRYSFDIIYQDKVKIKTENKNISLKVVKVRKCKYNNFLNLIIRTNVEGKSNKTFIEESHNFDNKDLLHKFFIDNFNVV